MRRQGRHPDDLPKGYQADPRGLAASVRLGPRVAAAVVVALYLASRASRPSFVARR